MYFSEESSNTELGMDGGNWNKVEAAARSNPLKINTKAKDWTLWCQDLECDLIRCVFSSNYMLSTYSYESQEVLAKLLMACFLSCCLLNQNQSPDLQHYQAWNLNLFFVSFPV